MKAVIPAAGEGKRFNKDSTYMHKCLVPINGKALLLYTLENLTNIKEITECIVIIGENHEKIIDTKDMILIEKKQCEDLSYCNLLIFPWNKKTLLNYAIAEIYKENHQLTKLKLVIVKRDLNKCNIEELGFELELCIRRFNNSCRDIVSYAYMIQEC